MTKNNLELNWFDDVVDRAPDIFHIIDRDGYILFTN